MKLNYLSEPSLNSELILVNNAKLLKQGKFAFNDTHIEEIIELRNKYEILDQSDDLGLQKTKRIMRDRIRDLSSITYVNRDQEIFGDMVLMMMDKMSTRPNFSGYSYKDEMKSLATEHIFKYTWKFDPYKQSEITGQYISAFTYISTIIFNAFVATINKQNDEHKKAKKSFLETQKLFHRDPNVSDIIPSHSEIDKTVQIVRIKNTLFEEIQIIKLDVQNILVKYPEDYHIDMVEYKKITDYSDTNNINLSIVRNIKLVEEAVTTQKEQPYGN